MFNEPSENLESKTVEDKLNETMKQLEDLRHLLDVKNDEICNLKKIICEQSEIIEKKTVIFLKKIYIKKM